MLIHSGRQFGGIPMNSGEQEQDGVSRTTEHCAFGPHGDGRQGSIGSGGVSAKGKISIIHAIMLSTI